MDIPTYRLNQHWSQFSENPAMSSLPSPFTPHPSFTPPHHKILIQNTNYIYLVFKENTPQNLFCLSASLMHGMIIEGMVCMGYFLAGFLGTDPLTPHCNANWTKLSTELN